MIGTSRADIEALWGSLVPVLGMNIRCYYTSVVSFRLKRACNHGVQLIAGRLVYVEVDETVAAGFHIKHAVGLVCVAGLNKMQAHRMVGVRNQVAEKVTQLARRIFAAMRICSYPGRGAGDVTWLRSIVAVLRTLQVYPACHEFIGSGGSSQVCIGRLPYSGKRRCRASRGGRCTCIDGCYNSGHDQLHGFSSASVRCEMVRVVVPSFKPVTTPLASTFCNGAIRHRPVQRFY